MEVPDNPGVYSFIRKWSVVETENHMRINEMINNINNGAGTGINTDLSSVNSAGSFKDKTTALFDDKMSAVGFFKASETKNVKRSFNYTLDEAKGLADKDGAFGDKLLNSLNGDHNNDKELVKNLTGDDYDDLSDEGMSLEKFSKERLERAIERIKENREFRDAQLSEGVEKRQDYRESVEKMAVSNLAENGSEKLIAKLLAEADIPVTEENIEEVKQAADIAVNAGKLNDSSESYLIKNGLAPTIGNIYKASHSGEMRTVKLDDASWEGLKTGALDIISEAGIGTEKGLESARWLVEHDIPVTAENISYKAELDEYNAKQNIDPARNEIYSAAVKSMQTGGSARDGMLIVRFDEAMASMDKEMADLIEKLPTVGNAAIHQAIMDGATEESVTLPQLLSAEEKVEATNQALAGITSKMSEEEVTVRIRLEEVRISLNLEAGRRLMANGIDILSDGLMRVSEGLRELQKELFENIYKEIGADLKTGLINAGEGTAESLMGISEAAELALETKLGLENISNSPLDFYKATFEVRHTVTLAELSADGELLIRESVSGTSGSVSVNPSSMQMALASYEGSSTEVRRDLGDSIKKAFAGSVDSLLSSNGLELTEANRRAVRILGYNSMEITAENIEEIKFFDAKVTGLIERMTGPVVMTMIRDGINPLECTVDELDAKVSSIINEQGNTLEQKYSEFLVRMEETNSITENERNAYIGIYRLLYNVEKDDGAAIGSLLNSGRELTFGNLMTEARTRVTAVDLSADDTTGVKTSSYTNSVTDQINTAFNYQRSLVRDSLGVTDPGLWDKALSGKNYPKVTIEELHDGLFSGNTAGNGSEDLTVNNVGVSDLRAQDIVKTMTANTPASAFLNSFGIKDSFENRKVVEDVLSGSFDEDSAISVTAEELNDALESGSKFDELLGIKTRMANALTGQAFRTAITAQAAAELNGRVERIGMLKALAGKGHYRLNVSDGEESKTVNLTIIRNEGNAGTVSVEIQKQDYNMQADLNLVMMDQRYNGPAITKGNVYFTDNSVSDNAGQTGSKDAYIEKIRTALENSGINADNINIVSENRSNESYVSYLAQQRKVSSDREENTNNKDTIFKVAKAVLSAF